MKKSIALATTIIGLLLMATTLAFAQQDRGLNQTFTSDSGKCAISKIISDQGRASMNVTLMNLRSREEYHLILFTSGGQELGRFWVDQEVCSLYVGNLPPDTYILVMMEGNQIVDRKQVLIR